MIKILRFKIPLVNLDKSLISFFILENAKNLQIIEIQDENVIFQAEFLNQNPETTINKFKKLFPNKDLQIVFEKQLNPEDWKKLRINTLEVGKFKFKPIFEKNQQDQDIIYLDTIVGAFGIDNHPSTIICLEFINNLNKNYNTAVDFGSGNGILSLALSKKNIQLILAIEVITSYCIEIKHNTFINNIDNIIVINHDSCNILKKIDLLVANIPFSVFLDYKVLATNFKDGILSGIHKSKQNDFINLLKTYDIDILEILEKDNWIGINCTKRN